MRISFITKLLTLSAPLVFASCSSSSEQNDKKQDGKEPIDPKQEYFGNPPRRGDTLNADLLYPLEEKHFAKLTQLTFGGNNAEAYFSPDSKRIVFQSDYEKWGVKCDQIFHASAFNPMKTQPKMVSTGMGRTTCSYFMPDGKSFLYASTHLGDKACPEKPPHDPKNYVWPIYNTFDIFVADTLGKVTKQLTKTPGYDAEATVSPKGDKIVFTSMRSGDLELYTMNIDGSNVKQITTGLGYDGGAFFSPDGTKLVFRASRPSTPAAIENYKILLEKGLVSPTEMEIYVCDVDGKNLKQVTNLGHANWAPFFHPSGNKIIFSSNHKSKGGYGFNLFMINLDGTGLEQISADPIFDAFPMFSPDGKHLIFSSNRNNGGTHDTNLFIATWKD